MSTKDDYERILNHILGLMVVDRDGNLTYINKQCADYIQVDQEASIGKPVREVFPATKLDEVVRGNKPHNTEFYFHEGRMSVSLQAQIIENGKVAGALEYDIIQDLDNLDELLGKYVLSLKNEVDFYRERVRQLKKGRYSIENLIGSSEAMEYLRKQIVMAAHSSSTVLITGETGTGKELVAQAIHNMSSRFFGEFVAVNASSLPESLAESELFGYEEGSFTGAKKGGKKGKFEVANNGTLFIDEINQMPMTLQPKLLRALQEKKIDPVGSEGEKHVDVRIIAATNKPLKTLVQQGLFREDLYYRLNVLSIEIPPLRERMSDLPELLEEKVKEFNKILGKNIRAIDPAVISKLQHYSFPGNIRELSNMVEKAMHFASGDTLYPEYFDDGNLHISASNLQHLGSLPRPIDEVKNQAEKRFIEEALIKFHGNKTKTAQFLKIPRALLYQKIKRLGIRTELLF